MRAIILAAGQGTRIRLVHGQHPKCLIEVDEKTILDHQLEALAMAGINEVSIVVGYEQEQIMSHVRSTGIACRQKIRFIENPAFATTNNIFSLWLALDWLHWLPSDSVMVLNADVIFDPEILIAATRATAPISMIVDPSWRDETMKVIIEGDRVTKMSKKISREEFSGTYIGITIFAEAVQGTFVHKMSKLISDGHVDRFFNVAVQELADEGIHVGFTTTEGLPWAEIDDPLDLMFARQNVFPQLAERVL